MTATSRTESTPRLNTPVLLSLPGVDHDVPSRVEDVRGDLVVVAAVLVPGRTERHGVGGLLTLVWAAPPRGLLSVACVLEHHELSQPPLWVLRPTGQLRRLQRRRFARADVAARVQLSGTATGATGEALGWSAGGMLADLSEGGAKVLLDAGQRVPTDAGGWLGLEALVGGEPLLVEASVVGTDLLAAGRHQVRLAFELNDRDSGRVRRAVMQRQLEARCGGARS